MVTSIMHVQEEVTRLKVEKYPESRTKHPAKDGPLEEHKDHYSWRQKQSKHI